MDDSIDRIQDPAQTNEELYRVYKGYQESWSVKAGQSEDFYLGKQWTAEEEEILKTRNQSPVVVNVILPAVEQAIALLTTNRPRFSSTAREDSDVKIGKMFADILTYLWDESLGNVQLKQAIKDYYVKGRGAILAYIDPYGDYGKGEVCIKALDPLTVYIDPNAKDVFCRDAAHMLMSAVYTRDEIRRLYPDVDFTDMKTTTDDTVYTDREQVTDFLHTKYRIIDRYTKQRVPFYHVYNPMLGVEKVMEDEEFQQYLQQPAVIQITQQGQQTVVDEEQVKEALQMIQQLGEVFHYAMNPETQQPEPVPGPETEDQMAIPGSTVQLQVITIQQVIESGEIMVRVIMENRILRVMSIGEKLYYQGIIKGVEEYPIVLLINRHAGSPFGISDVEVVKEMQKYVNKIRSLIIAHASNSTNVKVLVNRGSVDKIEFEREWSKAGTAVLEVDMELGQPIVVGLSPLPNELYKNEADARKDIQECLGIYALMQGDAGQAPATYKGTVALDEYGQRRIRSKKDDIEAFLNFLARILVQMIQSTYTEYKALRVVRPNNIEEKIEINKVNVDDISGTVKKINDITVGKYDVVVVSGSMLPSNRWAQFEYYMMMYEKGLIDQMEVLKKSEVVDTEGVLERMSIIQQLQQQLEAATQEIERLNGDIQTKDREISHMQKRVELEKFKTDIKSTSTEARAASSLYSARLTDQLKMSKLEEKAKNKSKGAKK